MSLFTNKHFKQVQEIYSDGCCRLLTASLSIPRDPPPSCCFLKRYESPIINDAHRSFSKGFQGTILKLSSKLNGESVSGSGWGWRRSSAVERRATQKRLEEYYPWILNGPELAAFDTCVLPSCSPGAWRPQCSGVWGARIQA